MFKILINALGFQIVWFTCALTVNNSKPWNYIFVALTTFTFLGQHFYFSKSPKSEIVLLVQIVFIGWTMDTLLALNHLIIFSNSFHAPLNFIQPLWLTCLWMSLAVTINHSLLWLQKLGSWCSVFGLVFGTLSYLAGERFQVLHFESLNAIEITAVCWATLIPLCLMLGKYQMIKAQQNI